MSDEKKTGRPPRRRRTSHRLREIRFVEGARRYSSSSLPPLSRSGESPWPGAEEPAGSQSTVAVESFIEEEDTNPKMDLPQKPPASSGDAAAGSPPEKTSASQAEAASVNRKDQEAKSEIRPGVIIARTIRIAGEKSAVPATPASTASSEAVSTTSIALEIEGHEDVHDLESERVTNRPPPPTEQAPSEPTVIVSPELKPIVIVSSELKDKAGPAEAEEAVEVVLPEPVSEEKKASAAIEEAPAGEEKRDVAVSAALPEAAAEPAIDVEVSVESVPEEKDRGQEVDKEVHKRVDSKPELAIEIETVDQILSPIPPAAPSPAEPSEPLLWSPEYAAAAPEAPSAQPEVPPVPQAPEPALMPARPVLSVPQAPEPPATPAEARGRRTSGKPPPPPVTGAAQVPAPPSKGARAPSKRQAKGARPWWERFFTDDYLRSIVLPSPAQIKRQCDFIDASLALPRGSTILDVGCGKGLQAIEMTTRGYLVVGLDLSLPMITRAAEDAQYRGLKINFLHADIREIAFDGAFDAVICMGTTFGFFDDESNRDVLARLYGALKPGGKLLLDVVNRDFVIRSQPNLIWFQGDGCVCMEESEFNYFSSRLQVKRTMMHEDSRQTEAEYSIRLYSLHELGILMHQMGFRVLEVSGQEATRGVFFGVHAPRLVILAERQIPQSSPRFEPGKGPEADGGDNRGGGNKSTGRGEAVK